MLNRNAEALFWVGRYVERAENHARLIDVHYHIQNEKDFHHEGHKWARLLDALGVRNDYLQHYEAFTEQHVLDFITLDRDNVHSVSSCVNKAKTNMRVLRQKLPSEMWDVVSAFDLWLGDCQVGDITLGPNHFYKQVKERAAIFLGTEESVMLRENEWYFIKSGRYLERAENTVRILKYLSNVLKEEKVESYPLLQAVLKSVSGYQAFRLYYADEVSVARITDFLVSNPQFPRSIRFAFHRLEDYLTRLYRGQQDKGSGQEKAIRLAGKIRAELDYLEEEQKDGEKSDELLDFLLSACHRLGGTIESAFFRWEGATG